MIPNHDRTSWIARHILPHEPALRAWLRRRAVAGLETDDVVQETYAVLAGLATVAHIASPRAYAFQTAQSIVASHVRRARIVRFGSMDDMDLPPPIADEPSPEHQAAARQDLMLVAQAIAALPAKCREAFTLRRIEGLSQRDIAHRMGISESTVEKHIGRAIRELMRRFATGGIYSAQASHRTGSRVPDDHDQCRN